MKYAEFILKHIIPEWALMYLNYKALKAYLSTSGALKDFLLFAKKTKSTIDYKDIKKNVLEMTYMITKIEADNKEFKKKFTFELSKLKTFINLKYNDLKGKTYKVQLQIFSMMRYQRQLSKRRCQSSIRMKSQVLDQMSEQLTMKTLKIKESELNQKSKQLKELCFQLYQEGVNFDKYLEVNQEAIRKIIKKWDKKMVKVNLENSNLGECKKIVEELEIHQIQTKVKQLLFQVEKYLLKHFYPTKPDLCKEQLRKYSYKENKNDKAWFQFGLFTGFSLMLLSFIIFLATQNQLTILDNSTIFESFPIYRGSLLFILYYWTLTILVYIWNKKKVNYKLYFAFNHHFSTINESLKRVMTLTTIFLLVSITYVCDESKLGVVFSNLKGEDYYPLIIWASLFMTLFFPSKVFINGKGRIWLYKNIIQSVKIKQVAQRHIFIITQLTSLFIPFTDFTYTICEYSRGIQNPDPKQECFFVSRYITMGLGLFPYFILTTQIIFMTIQKESTNKYIIEVIKNILSMCLIIFSTLSYDKKEFFIYWLIFTIVSIIMNLFSYCQQWGYLDERESAKSRVSYKTRLMLVYLPFALVQPLSISTPIFSVFDKNKQHGLPIFYIGCAELIGRMICNYYQVAAEHHRNKQTYQTVGMYVFPFEDCCNTIRKTQLKYYEFEDSDEEDKDDEERKSGKKIVELVEEQNFEEDKRLNFGLCVQGSDNIESQNKTTMFQRNKFNISELVQKESEKALGESFLNYDIIDFKPDVIEQLMKCQQIPQSEIQRLQFNNQHYKKEIKQLYETYGIKVKQ